MRGWPAGFALAGLALASALAGGTQAAHADPPSRIPLALPLDCRPGIDCWVINHVDLDPGPGRRDYRCGSMTDDGHNGTGFGLSNLARLDDHIAVRAAAPGVVVGIRDGMADISVAVAGPKSVEGHECGNGVRIEHDGGWDTQYCHLKRGSVSVEPGQPVATGEYLGAVGLSGMTEYPHLLFAVRKNGEVVDPFRGIDGGPECGPGMVPLWDDGARRVMVDHAPILLDSGFASGPVDVREAEAGTAGLAAAGTDAAVLVLWARAAGIEPGDVMMFVIEDPDGGKVTKDLWRADKTRIVQFLYYGKRRTVDAWAPGVYIGHVILKREGRPARGRTVSIRLGSRQ